jgi:hypothetical protein
MGGAQRRAAASGERGKRGGAGERIAPYARGHSRRVSRDTSRLGAPASFSHALMISLAASETLAPLPLPPPKRPLHAHLATAETLAPLAAGARLARPAPRSETSGERYYTRYDAHPAAPHVILSAPAPLVFDGFEPGARGARGSWWAPALAPAAAGGPGAVAAAAAAAAGCPLSARVRVLRLPRGWARGKPASRGLAFGALDAAARARSGHACRAVRVYVAVGPRVLAFLEGRAAVPLAPGAAAALGDAAWASRDRWRALLEPPGGAKVRGGRGGAHGGVSARRLNLPSSLLLTTLACAPPPVVALPRNHRFRHSVSHHFNHGRAPVRRADGSRRPARARARVDCARHALSLAAGAGRAAGAHHRRRAAGERRRGDAASEHRAAAVRQG